MNNTMFNFSHDDVDHEDTNQYVYYPVTFNKKFGRITKGTTYELVSINYEQGIMRCFNSEDDYDDESPCFTQKFTIIPLF